MNTLRSRLLLFMCFFLTFSSMAAAQEDLLDSGSQGGPATHAIKLVPLMASKEGFQILAPETWKNDPSSTETGLISPEEQGPRLIIRLFQLKVPK